MSVPQQIVETMREMVGLHGLSYLQAAAIANKKLRLRELFKYELNKNKVAGICQRAGIKVAKELSEEGRRLLKEMGTEVTSSHSRLVNSLSPTRQDRRLYNGFGNRLMNAQLRAQAAPAQSAPRIAGRARDIESLPVEKQRKIRKTAAHFLEYRATTPSA